MASIPTDGPEAYLGERFHFLFVGASVPRKGFDVLLAAYRRAFSARDPVCLVVKDHTGDVFYKGQYLTGAVQQHLADREAPSLRYIDDYLPDHELAALYRACDAGVFPYRAEGFAMPILEAMACGLPSLVPRFGACLDYCADNTTWFLEPRRIRLSVGKEMAYNTLGFREEIQRVDFCQVQIEHLAERMREVFKTSAESRKARGAAAAATALSGWSWDHSIAALSEILRAP